MKADFGASSSLVLPVLLPFRKSERFIFHRFTFSVFILGVAVWQVTRFMFCASACGRRGDIFSSKNDSFCIALKKL